jgi:hypothetical protein
MRRLTKYVPVLALVLSATGLRAETPAPAAPATPPASPPKPAPRLSLADAQDKAKTLDNQIEGDMRFVLHLKEQAKKEKDVIKLGCVNDRIVQLKAKMNLSDETRAAIEDAFARNSDERHALLITYGDHAQQIRQLREEAVACIGAPELYKQESGGNETDHPPIPDDPMKDDPFHEDVEPPGYASPFH